MSKNNAAAIAAGKEKSIELRKHFDDMTTLQLRQFFKSSQPDTLKKIVRNIVWAMDQNTAQSDEEALKQIEESQNKIKELQEEMELNKKRRTGRNKQLEKYL